LDELGEFVINNFEYNTKLNGINNENKYRTEVYKIYEEYKENKSP